MKVRPRHTSPTMSTPSPMPRRSARIAAKSQPTYSEPEEEIDEVTEERIQTMFDVLLEESYEKVTKEMQLPSVFRNCCKRFCEMFADLPEDDMERRAAEDFIRSLEPNPFAYIHNHKLHKETLERLRKPKEELREKRRKLFSEEITSLIKLTIELHKQVKNSHCAEQTFKYSPYPDLIKTQRKAIIKECIESIDKDYLYLVQDINKALTSGKAKYITRSL